MHQKLLLWAAIHGWVVLPRLQQCCFPISTPQQTEIPQKKKIRKRLNNKCLEFLILWKGSQVATSWNTSLMILMNQQQVLVALSFPQSTPLKKNFYLLVNLKMYQIKTPLDIQSEVVTDISQNSKHKPSSVSVATSSMPFCLLCSFALCLTAANASMLSWIFLLSLVSHFSLSSFSASSPPTAQASAQALMKTQKLTVI